MKEIRADDKTVRDVLDKVKYTVDFFQREYRWERKHVEQLIDDLTSKFFSNFDGKHERKEVKNYERYYLGPIVLSDKDGELSIIDGQQRLTSITLLLIYLNNLQKNRDDAVVLKDLIFSEKYAEKSFNIQVEDRKECIEALYNNQDYDISDKGESVKNIVERYHDIEDLFPDELKEKALPYFIDWLIDNVIFVKIITYSDEDAYTIFETMNDRGLNLTSTEMLKGYILSNVRDMAQKHKINEIWKDKVLSLKNIAKEEDLEFFKAWLRAKYAESIRPGKKGAANEDFEKIGTRFHSWVRDNDNKIGLKSNADFYNFVMNDFDFFCKLYIQISEASSKLNESLESIFSISERGLAASIYYPLLAAPVNVGDDKATIIKKLALVSRFLEMFVVFRSVNYKNYSHSSIRYTMYTLVKEIRGKSVTELTKLLKEKASEFEHNLDGFEDLRMHGQNKKFIHFLLARITKHIEQKSGVSSSFEDYMEIAKPFQIEHIWADKHEEHEDEFDQKNEFDEYRNRIGDLLLVQEGFNQSYNDEPYEKKLPHYFGQNLLAKSLNERCYQKNPEFLKYVSSSKLPFKSYPSFKKKDIIERQKLYKKICEEIWSLDEFDKIAKGL
jgi:uncharacterized protein with ParB-like and HNH nuclease domain